MVSRLVIGNGGDTVAIAGRKAGTSTPAVSPKQPRDPLIALAEPRSAVAEAYRTARTNLQFIALEQTKKTLLVTSAGPGEGKTTTTANLGATMAMAGSQTLLVDADLRRPTLHKYFSLSNTIGLTTVLTEKTAPETGIVATRVANLFVLPSGPIPPNPAEMLGSRRMGELADLTKARFDLVLFDAPPVMAASDALVLARLADGVILVVQSGKLPYELIRQAKKQLDDVKANLLGVLLNSVNVKRDGYYSQYYCSQYYGYGSRNGDE